MHPCDSIGFRAPALPSSVPPQSSSSHSNTTNMGQLGLGILSTATTTNHPSEFNERKYVSNERKYAFSDDVLKVTVHSSPNNLPNSFIGRNPTPSIAPQEPPLAALPPPPAGHPVSFKISCEKCSRIFKECSKPCNKEYFDCEPTRRFAIICASITGFSCAVACTISCITNGCCC